jgi:hypothetical protein
MAKVSTAELRRFGLTVGGALVALGLVSWWRGHTVAPRVLGALGGFLVVLGALAPGLLAPVQRFWMGPVLRVTARVGDVVSRAFLILLFFLVFAPIGAVMRRVRDPLNRSLADDRRSQWIKRPPGRVEPARYEQTF